MLKLIVTPSGGESLRCLGTKSRGIISIRSSIIDICAKNTSRFPLFVPHFNGKYEK